MAIINTVCTEGGCVGSLSTGGSHGGPWWAGPQGHWASGLMGAPNAPRGPWVGTAEFCLILVKLLFGKHWQTNLPINTAGRFSNYETSLSARDENI